MEPWDGPFLAQRERAAIAAMRDPKFKYKDRLNWAIEDAKTSIALKNSQSGPEVDRMRKTRAAAAATAVDLKRRCGRCKTCTYPFSVSKKHLLPSSSFSTPTTCFKK